ncbi:MAG: hypothetical protein LBN20_01735, partial [Endomicrobium sp.]|nr:hypothetical protein [Endomicrobium sp.]
MNNKTKQIIKTISKIKAKLLLTALVLAFVSIQVFAIDLGRLDWTTNQTYDVGDGNYFQNLTATNGGAVSIVGVTSFALTGTSVTFMNNIAGGGNGGAIYINNSIGVFTINTVYFTNNSATTTGAGNGGAISVQNGSSITFNGDYIRFAGNSAEGTSQKGGGAIYINASDVIMNVNTVIFDYNYARTDGGSFLLHDGARFIVPWQVDSMTLMGARGNYGPGMYVMNSQAIFMAKEVKIIDNSAAQYGGAMRLTSRAVVMLEDIVIFGSTAHRSKVYFEKNTASYGGVISFDTANTTGSISFINVDIQATSNVANNNGGVIYLGIFSGGYPTNSIIQFINSSSSFIGNSAQFGASIYLDGADGSNKVIFDGGSVEFTSNASLAANSEGNIAIINGSMEIKNLISMVARSNRAASGGFLYVPSLVFNFNGALMEMIGNTAFGTGLYGRGGAFYLDGATATFAGSEMNFKENVALLGGALYATGGASVTFAGENMNFIGNIA